MSELAQELFALVDELNRRFPSPRGRGHAEEVPFSLWSTLMELGLPRIGIPEHHGGVGGELDDLAVVVQALATYGHGTPLVEASTAAWAAQGVAAVPATGLGVVAVPHMQAGLPTRRFQARWGRLAHWAIVVHADAPPQLITFDGADVVEEADVAGEPVDTIEVQSAVVVDAGELPSQSALRARMGILRTSALLGTAYGVYDLTREHVLQRRQFDRPLAEIPAVRHALAEMRTGLVQTQAAHERALDAWRGGTPEQALVPVAAARIIAAQTASACAQVAHQLHGAMGVTNEYALHRFTRRLWAWRDADTTERQWAEELGARVLSASEHEFWEVLTS
ncbi:acyl-CoA dehydrogenase family protein [Yinghuangia aomiensis]|uniref:Acyl-CoA dehydrogenase family protein n=1 Tax=Yinghuangia aomiensis TaxID=676205 RepID=A0ABP9HU88_9ACTN